MKYNDITDMGVFYPKIVMLKLTDRVDVFSLGIILFRMLMGDAPVLALSYHSGSCKNQACFKSYIKELKNARVSSNEEYPPVKKL